MGLEHRFIDPAEASALAILDLDGDGDGDVLRATSAGLLVQEQVAPGTYQVTRNLGNADGLTSIHFVDLDGDGDHDLLLPFRTSGAVRWAQGLGGGNFAAMADLLSGLNEVFLARAAYLDGDMDLDLIYAHDAAVVNISWSENTGGMSYGPGQLAGLPLHFTACHPDFKLDDLPPTPPATLQRARSIARAIGLQHVYTGNVHDRSGGTTHCARCGAALIERDWYEILGYRLDASGCCPTCATRLAGHFGTGAGGFGARRIPVRIEPAQPRL